MLCIPLPFPCSASQASHSFAASPTFHASSASAVLTRISRIPSIPCIYCIPCIRCVPCVWRPSCAFCVTHSCIPPFLWSSRVISPASRCTLGALCSPPAFSRVSSQRMGRVRRAEHGSRLLGAGNALACAFVPMARRLRAFAW